MIVIVSFVPLYNTVSFWITINCDECPNRSVATVLMNILYTHICLHLIPHLWLAVNCGGWAASTGKICEDYRVHCALGGSPERIYPDSMQLSYIHHGWIRRLHPSAYTQPVLSRGCCQSWTSADEGGVPCDSGDHGDI